MSKFRLLSAAAVTAVALGGLAVTALPAQAAQHVPQPGASQHGIQHGDTQTIKTTVNGNGWAPNAQGPGSGQIVGAIAPDGRDAAEFTTQGDGTIETLFGTQYIGLDFLNMTGLSYDTYVANSAEQILAPSIGMEIWGGDTDAFLGSMVYEPYVADPSQPVTDGVWQDWNAMDPNALWWSTKDVTDPQGDVVIPAQQAETLATFEAAWAANPDKYENMNTENGVKVYVGDSAEDPGWDGFDAYVDDVQVTTTGDGASDIDWDFTTGLGPCAATVDDDTQTYTLIQDCTTYQTITVPDGWTLDGAGYTITAVEDATQPDFPGPIVTSAEGTDDGPATMNVENLNITTQGFGGGNSGGNLAGIKYDRAGGTVSNVSVNGVSDGNGVQEGIGIWVRNRDASGSYSVPPATVSINNATVTDYQKGGIVLDGNLGFTLTDSVVGQSAGPDGAPIDDDIAANSVQVSRAAHGDISDNQIALNDYNPQPPPGDGSDATAILLYDAKTVNVYDNVISGENGDVAIDNYNDSLGVLDTVLNASCNLITRNEDPGHYDPYGVGIAQWNDGSTPVTINLSDTTFSGWNYNTATISYDEEGDLQFGQGAPDQQLDQCPPTPPTNVAASGGDDQTDVTWDASTAPVYAPLSGYTVTATDSQGQVDATAQVGPDATSAHLDGLQSGTDYTITVEAQGGGGTADGSTTLYATTLTLTSVKGQVKYDGPGTTLNGTLTSDDPDAQLAGRSVDIQSAPAGSDDWSDYTTVTTDGSGDFSADVAPDANTDYRAVYGGDPDLSSVSNTAPVNVSMSVKDRVSKKKPKLGKKVKFSGAVAPSNPGGDVELQMKQSDGTWQAVATASLDAESSYGFKWKSTQDGTFLFRVMADGDSTHVTGYSKTVKITVH